MRQQIKEIIDTYKSQAPTTPILLLTAMAEGADQIAAEVGLESDGVFVIAVLPFTPADYGSDFESEETLANFHTLLSKCHAVLEADDYYDHPNHLRVSGDGTSESITARTHAYRDCARLISQQSHVLIAVWDGVVSTLSGGTSDTITHRLSASKQIQTKNEHEHAWPLISGTLLHISARREEIPDACGSITAPLVPEIRVLTESDGSQKWSSQRPDLALANFELLNSLLESDEYKHLKKVRLTNALMEIADVESAKLQRSFKRQVAVLLSAGIVALFTFDLQHDFSTPYPFGLTVITLLGTALLWLRFVKGTLRDQFYQFRSLAEGLRVQAVWLDCAISRDASNEYLRGVPDVLWIPRAMRTSRFLDGIQHHSGELDDIEVASHATDWIQGQIRYFEGDLTHKGAIAESHFKKRTFDALSLGNLALAMVCLFLDSLRFKAHQGSGLEDFLRIEQLVMYLSLSVSAGSAAYSNLMAYREIERQYEIGLRNFKQGLDILTKEELIESSKRESIQSVVIQIGREALQETGTWLSLKRDRAVNPI